MPRRGLYTAGAVLAIAVLFQLFFRYQYMQDRAQGLLRIDRVTGSECRMPCTPAPPAPTPTPYDRDADADRFLTSYNLLQQRAIAIAKQTSQAQSIVATAPDDEWSATNVFDEFMIDLNKMTPSPSATPSPPTTATTPDPVMLVAYQNKKGFGWRWEVNTTTGEAFFVNDNATLEKKYGLESK